MVIRLHSRTSAAFLAADLKQARVDAVTAAANQAFVERIPVPSCTPARLLLLTAHSTHTDRVGFEPTVPLRAHRFSRPAVSTAHAPVHSCLLSPSLPRIGWDSNPRNGYPFTRSPGACLQPLGHLSRTTRRTDAQTHRRADAQTHKRVVNTRTVPVSLRAAHPAKPRLSERVYFESARPPMKARSDA